MIRLVNVTLIYPNHVVALRNVSLEIRKQEFVILKGHTGCGKSSLLRLLYRDVVASEGSVYVFHRDLSKMSPRDIPYLRRRIGVVFQDFLLIPTKTAYQNVSYALEARGASLREIRTLTPEVLEMVGLGDKLNCLPEELSGGEQQRVCLARALVNKPDLLLADEPTGNLDAKTSREIMQLIASINRKGTTVIVATHDPEVFDHFGERVIELEEGVLVRDARR